MKILNLLTSGAFGGIEVLCRDISEYSHYENAFCFLFEEGPIYDYMSDKKKNVYSLCGFRKISVKRLGKLIQIAKSYDCIVVHHSDPFLQMYYFALKLKYKGKKYIATIHSCFDEELYFGQYGWLKKKIFTTSIKTLLKTSDRIIFVSQAGYGTYKEAFTINPAKVRIVYNGIGMDKLRQGANAAIKRQENIRLIFVGRLVRIKGVHLLLEAFEALSHTYSLKLLIVGDGDERKSLEKLAVSLGIFDAVEFCGAQSNVGSYLEKSDIFVYPSICQEVFGISIVEAMAYGRICVANNVGGIPEIIEDGVNGFLNFTNDAAGLRRALEKAISVRNDNIAYEMMRKATQATAEKFSIEKTIEHLEEIFTDLAPSDF